MIGILAIMCLLGIAFADQPEAQLVGASGVQAQKREAISSWDCVERVVYYGYPAICPGGFVATSLCTSDKTEKCNGVYTRVRCCAVDSSISRGCERKYSYAHEGKHTSCRSNGVVNSICTSYSGNNCGRNAHTAIECWEESGLRITAACTWRYAHFGQNAECLNSEVMTRVCSSGTTGKCEGKSHGVHCCRIR